MSELRDEKHCPSCTCGKRAPVQGSHREPKRGNGSITWAEHLEAFTGMPEAPNRFSRLGASIGSVRGVVRVADNPTPGDVVLRRVDERIEIVSADDVAWFSSALLAEIELGFGDNGVELADDVLTIRGTNRTVVYRLGDYDPFRRAYVGTMEAGA